MAFEAGTQLGHYQILSPAGAGGMGEVYKAIDPRLNRTVAVKVLPSHIADKPDIRQRFEREAQAIAALNHPHICVVHDVGQHEGTAFIVMEYIEGETLADRLAKGPLPFAQLLTYSIQIADALDKAHRRGVVHRDLKPGNIMLTRSGVKLLDFGLAKLQEPLTAQAHSTIPTVASISQPLTVGGTILGTLQYMSPEQLEGKDADARSDIFAFGAVLYEMATGRRAFEGKSQVSVMAAILEHEPPPVSSLQPVAPPLFDDVIRICLAKNPDDRWQTAADLLHELKLLVRHGTLPVSVPERSRKRENLAWVSAAALAIGLVSMVLFFAFRSPPPLHRVSFEVRTPAASAGFESMMIALSPDGSRLAFLASENNVRSIWVRQLDQVTAVKLPGTEGAIFPFWSADGRSIGFFADGQLRSVDIAGGPPLTLTSATQGRGGTWNRDGVILFAPTQSGPLFRVSAASGIPTQVTELNESRKETAHKHPSFLPDGIHFLYLVLSAQPENAGIYVGSLNSTETSRLLPAATSARFAAPDSLFFMRENTLMMQRFNTNSRKLEGEPVRVAEGVGTIGGTGNLSGFTVSENGTLAYRPGGSTGNRTLTWIDGSGKPLQNIGTPAVYENPRLSPDGKRLAVFKRESSPGGDIWIFDLESGGSPSRLTFDAAEDNYPLWSSDGSQIIFASNRDGGVFNFYQKSSSGGEDKPLFKSPNNKIPTDLSTDGLHLLYEENDPKTGFDVWVLNMSGERKATRLFGTAFAERWPAFSPKSRWIAYSSNETDNTYEVYVQDFPPSGGKWQVSTSGGLRPRWRADGKELFYSSLANALTAVDLSGTSPGQQFKRGTPRPIFPGMATGNRNGFDITRDNDRFLVLLAQTEAGGTPPIIVILNWAAGLLQ